MSVMAFGAPTGCVSDVARFAVSPRTGSREPLPVRKQLAPFLERKLKPHRADDSTRLLMVILGGMFSWRDALLNDNPDRFIRWHRKGFRLLWRWKSRPVGGKPDLG
jgi:putative transposase